MSLLKKIDDFLIRSKPIHLCWLFEKLGVSVPRYFVGWSDTGGGDHGGADWSPANGLEIAGNHTNIGAFNVLNGRIVYVKAYNGAGYGSVEIHANTISIIGTLTASGKGYGGGGAGGGGGGSGLWAYHTCYGGAGGAGVAGGAAGSAGSRGVNSENYKGADGGNGGAGGGVYGGAGGAKGVGTSPGGNGTAGSAGKKGGYATSEGQGDGTTDESLRKGSGAGGAGGAGGGGAIWVGGDSAAAGGGGGGGAANRGGGWIKLYATTSITISSNIYAKGLDNSTGNGGVGAPGVGTCNGGGGGAASSSGLSNGGAGGAGQVYGAAHAGSGGIGGEGGWGAGGGILLKCLADSAITITGTIDNRGGNNQTNNGGTIKIFYGGTAPSTTTIYRGRLYTRKGAWYETYTENINLTDTINVFRMFHRVFTETLTLSDTLKKKVGKVFSENINLSDVFSRRWSIYRTYTETINLADTVSKKVAKLFTETLHLQDTFSRVWHIYRTFTETINLADTLRKKIGKTFIESLTLADTLVKRAIRQRANLLQALESDAMFPGGVVRNLQHGADTEKLSSPVRGDWYIAIDTQKVYVCFIDGSWVQIYP